MASVHQVPGSKFWQARFRDVHGKQKSKTTRRTDERQAQRLADIWERPWQAAKCRPPTDADSAVPTKDAPEHPPLPANIVRQESSFTGLPAASDLAIRASFTSSARVRQGGGTVSVLDAARRLAALENNDEKRTIPGNRMNPWLLAWEQLGRALFDQAGNDGMKNLLRRVHDTLEAARAEENSATSRTTKEQCIYWWIACFFKIHSRLPSIAELEVNLADFVSDPTLKRTLVKWKRIFEDKNPGFRLETLQDGVRKDIENVISTSMDFEEGRAIYCKLSKYRSGRHRP